jgi:YggT family protein
MGLIALVIYWLLQVYFFALIGRFVFDLILSLNRQWQPRGVLVIVVELIYTVTDPPLKFVRRILPNLRLGAIQLDFSWTIVMAAVLFVERLVLAFA